MGTKNNPSRFDCYANAHPDEPMFILLGRDRNAGALVRLWAEARETAGEKREVTDEALACAKEMDGWAIWLGKEPEAVLPALPFDVLAEDLRRRGATVAPAPHGGDFAVGIGPTTASSPMDRARWILNHPDELVCTKGWHDMVRGLVALIENAALA